MKHTPKSYMTNAGLRSLAARSGHVLRREGPLPFLMAIYRRVMIRLGLRTRADFFPNEFQDAGARRVFAKLDYSAEPFGLPQGFDVLCLPIIDWDYRFQRPQQLLTRLAERGHRIFYGSVHTNPDTFEPGDILGSMRVQGERIWDFQLPTPPEAFDLYQQQPDAEQVAFFADSIAALRREAGLLNTLLVVDFPTWAPLAEELRRRFGWPIVYDCMEDHAGHTALPVDLIQDCEQALARSADLTLAVSEKIAERLRGWSGRVALSPNAADFLHFRYPLTAVDPFIHLRRPVIGYIGVITEWFDLDLVCAAARLRPDWSFVLIGEVFSIDISAAKALPNIHFLGEQPYGELPRFASYFDVAVIPHKRSRRTEWAGSVKLYEYLSTGRPVVATPLAYLQPLHAVVRLAAEPGQFVAQIEAALAEETPACQAARLDFARAQTWEARAADLETRANDLFPLASIIILTHNNLDVTRLCLDSLRAETDYPAWEVIFVDNASSDGTVEYLHEQQAADPRVRVLLNEHNAGFAAGNNQGVAAARGEYIVLLNNDTIVTRGWLTRLIQHLSDPTIGAVGPVTNMSGNESRIEVPYRSLAGILPFARAWARAHAGKTLELLVLTMFCVAYRREIIDEVGPLDERYGMGMFEDDDYARRLRQAGYRLVCAEDVFVHHFGNVSFRSYGEDLYQRLLIENRQKYEDKWGEPWQPHQARERA